MRDTRQSSRVTLPALVVCLLPVALVASQDRHSKPAAAILEQVHPPREELQFLEVDPRGNVIIHGQAELVVNYNDVEDSAVYADLVAPSGVSVDERLAGEIGSRCATSVRALALRELHGDGATVVCMRDSRLYDALNPHR